jgi:aldehyde decarbonylase
MLCRDDQVILTALLLYALEAALPMARGLPWWDSRGLAVLFLVHAGPVEFLYYWFHRALHHHYLYSR